MGEDRHSDARRDAVAVVDPLLPLLFWGSAALLFHNFVGFGLTVRWLAAIKGRPARREMTLLPTITVLIPAHNEEAVIALKLESVLSQEYPPDRREVIIASDVSSDRTDQIVRGFESRGVTLVSLAERHGKLGVLDELIPKASGEVVVVTDANVILAPHALQRLAEAYADPAVGAASGYQTVELPGRQTPLREEVSYRNYEARLKVQLGRLGCLVGAFGGFYSLRRECFRPIGSRPMADDMVLPLEVLAQRRKVVFVPDAVGNEEIGRSLGEEFRRRIRMTAYNLNAAGRVLRLAFRGGALPLYVVVSYKLLRWVAPLLWGIVGATALLLADNAPIYTAAAGIVVSGMTMTVIGAMASLLRQRWGPFSQAYYFALMNTALLLGVIGWMRGVKRYWTPERGK